MKRILVFAVIGGAIGVVAGYYIFGTVGGTRISIEALLSFGSGGGLGGAIRRAAGDVAGLPEIRRNILLTGAVAAGVAAFTAVLSGGGGRRRRR
jgi:hypothetical protein